MFIRINIWTNYRNADSHVYSKVWIYCKSREFRGHYIFYSIWNIILQIVFPVKKWQWNIEDQQEGGLSVNTDLFCYCCVRYLKKTRQRFFPLFLPVPLILMGAYSGKIQYLQSYTITRNILTYAGLYGEWRVWIWILWTLFFLAFAILCNGLIF